MNYDCYMLEKYFSDKIDYATLALALKNTTEKRKSIGALSRADNILTTLQTDFGQKSLWERYQKNNTTEGKINFAQTIESIRRLLKKAGVLHD